MSFQLKEEILMLIDSKREDDYWDFKVKYHSNSANLLHDIICMANNRVDRDSYIIFGVVDGTCEVVGIEGDENRRNQQQMTDFLKDKKFISGIRPRVEVNNLIIYGLEIDVLVIKNSTDTPYYLTEDYQDQGRKVCANYIYTRVGDTNTDINKSADINNVEYLWKKRFLLTRSPFEQILKRLEDKDEWKSDESNYYNFYNPEFTIAVGDQDGEYEKHRPEFYSYALMNSSTTYQKLSIKYFGTNLYNILVVVLDGGRYMTPTPQWAFLTFGEHKIHPDYAFKYFIKDSASYKLNKFLYNENDSEETYARRRFFEVVLLFNDELEKELFLNYVYDHQEDFINRLNVLDNQWFVNVDDKDYRNHIIERLKTGKVLKQMLLDFQLKCR